jgi:lipid-binding SYLF domain-containing protein
MILLPVKFDQWVLTGKRGSGIITTKKKKGEE